MQKLKYFKVNWKKLFSINFFLSFLILFFFSIYFLSVLRYQIFDSNNLIDGAWQLSLSSLRHYHNQILSRDIFFTYGPIYPQIITVLHPLDNLNTFIVSNIKVLILYALLITPLALALKKTLSTEKFIFLLFFIISLLSDVPIDTFFISYLFLLSGFFLNYKNSYFKLILLLGIVILSFFKNSFLFLALLCLPLLLLGKKINSSSVIYFTALSATLYLVFFFLSHGNIFEFIQYLFFSFINSSSYAEFMTIPIKSVSIPLIVIYFIVSFSFLLIFIIRKNFLLNLIQSLTVFLILKQSVIRPDNHLLIFFPFGFLISSTLVLNLVKGSKFYYSIIVTFIISILIQVIFVLPIINVSYQQYISDLSSNYTLKKLNRFDYYTFEDLLKTTKRNYSSLEKETKLLRDSFSDYLTKRGENKNNVIIVNYSNASFYTETLGFSFFHGPFLQNYAAFPPKLTDGLYLKFLKDHPDFYVFYNDTMSSIDGRIAYDTIPNTFSYLVNNYIPVAQDLNKRTFILKRKSTVNEPNCSLLKSKNEYFNKAFDVENSKDQVLYKFKFNNDYFERIGSLIFKQPLYYIEIFNSEGGKATFRTFKSSLENGIYFHPLYLSYDSVVKKQLFDLNKVVILSNYSKNKSFEIQIYKCY